MKPKVKIDEMYIAQFESKCGTCLRRSNGKCAFSGEQIADVMFAVRRYFGLCMPSPSPIPCPIFAELKRGFDEELRQVPARLALERARREVGPRTLTGKKMIEGG